MKSLPTGWERSRPRYRHGYMYAREMATLEGFPGKIRQRRVTVAQFIQVHPFGKDSHWRWGVLVSGKIADFTFRTATLAIQTVEEVCLLQTDLIVKHESRVLKRAKAHQQHRARARTPRKAAS